LSAITESKILQSSPIFEPEAIMLEVITQFLPIKTFSPITQLSNLEFWPIEELFPT
jgi:hypothetical protein